MTQMLKKLFYKPHDCEETDEYSITEEEILRAYKNANEKTFKDLSDEVSKKSLLEEMDLEDALVKNAYDCSSDEKIDLELEDDDFFDEKNEKFKSVLGFAELMAVIILGAILYCGLFIRLGEDLAKTFETKQIIQSDDVVIDGEEIL